MPFGLPNSLVYELRRYVERVQSSFRQAGLRSMINNHPILIVSMVSLSAVLLIAAVVHAWRPTSPPSVDLGRQSWFYDQNSGKLFLASVNEAGPIEAPSGPTTNGEPAGVRAQVYSYLLNPRRADLFVGFLEKPDPYSPTQPTTDILDLARWAEGKLIKRVDDPDWVAATSSAGQDILQAVSRPNRQGQTAIYQKARPL